MPRHALPFLVLGLAAGIAQAATSSTSLAGRVLDERRHPVAGARVQLRNPLSGYRQGVRTDASGRFVLRNVPLNEYRLEVFAEGMEAVHRHLELRAPLPVELGLVLRAAGATVPVEERLSLMEGHPAIHLDMDRSSIRTAPAAVQSRAMEALLLATPGFAQNADGRFHFRGSHGQVMYVVDGVPVTDQIHASFSNSLDPSQVESLEVITGGVSAEYGGKPVAVVNVTTRSGLGTPGGFEGSVALGGASSRTFEESFELRGGGERLGYFATGSTSRSDRFLDAVSFENRNNRGWTRRVFTRVDVVPGDRDALRVSLSGGDTRRGVMNLASQQAAGQDQRVRTADLNLNLGWTHLFTARRSLDVSAYYRRATAALDPTRDLQPGFAAGGPDTPCWARQDRSLENLGLQAVVTQRLAGDSTLKVGLQHVSYPLREDFRFALTRDGLYGTDSPLYPYTPAGGGSIWAFRGRLTPRLSSAFIQNDLHAGRLVLALGLRYDLYTVQHMAQGELQPRLGIAYRLPATRTVFRASYDRLLVTRENENLALSLSQAAWDLGPYAGTPVPPLRPELQDSVHVGAEQQVGNAFLLAGEYWEKRSRNAADSGPFQNTDVVFPVGMRAGRFHGWDLRLALVPVAGVSGYLSLGRTRARVQAPVVGGLQLEAPEAAPGVWFLIDHDQRLAGQLGLRYERQGLFVQALGRYDSGLVGGDPKDVEGDPDYAFGLPHLTRDAEGTWRSRSRTVWTFNAGRAFRLPGGRRLELGVDLLNAFDQRALYTFRSGCGGTHVIPPRTLAGRIRYVF